MKKINKFDIAAIILISIFSICITPITFQNDTFYTIKVGESIIKNGIDMQDHFSIHEDLAYSYPHWLYDVCTYFIYLKFGFLGLYIATAILACILSVTLYYTTKKLAKNNILSFFVTIIIMFLMQGFIAARAQLVTYTLFVLTIYNIEEFLEKKSKKNVIALFVIPTIIANVHIAVFPFYFILYLPYIAEYIVSRILIDNTLINKKIVKIDKKIEKSHDEEVIKKLNKDKEKLIKRKEKRKNLTNNTYKIIINKPNKNVKKLIIIMILTLFTGLITPLKLYPYTYLILTMLGKTTYFIAEHQASVLAHLPMLGEYLVLIIGVLMFSRVKIKLSDMFLVIGLTILTINSQRQSSLLFILTAFIVTKMLSELLKLHYKKELKQNVNKEEIIILSIITLLLSANFVYGNIKNESEFVNKKTYPVKACEYILKNIDLKEARFFNEYDFGSYMILKDIEVFIDSRADLYDTKFSKKEEDIFYDYMQVMCMKKYYGEIFDKYNITHIITYKSSELNINIEGINSSEFEKIYEDNIFAIYKYTKNQV